jgi:hypothetical protein
MSAQHDMFPAAPAADGGLVGLKVKLDHPVDRERPCCRNVCIISAGKGPHAGALHCVDCGKPRGWLSKPMAAWIENVISRFGAPVTPIVVRKSHTYETPSPNLVATAPKARANENVCQSAGERQRHIEEIKRLIARAGLEPRDFFFTQPPAPEEKDKAAYRRWLDHDHRRWPIAQRMYRHGLTAHDLAPASPPAAARSPRSSGADQA